MKSSISPSNTIKPPPRRNFQSTSTPDINLERDLIDTEAEVLLGMETAELASTRFRVNIATILISALVFLMILSWFDFIQTAFFSWLAPESQPELVPASVKLWYALLVTIMVLILVILIYYYTRHHMK